MPLLRKLNTIPLTAFRKGYSMYWIVLVTKWFFEFNRNLEGYKIHKYSVLSSGRYELALEVIKFVVNELEFNNQRIAQVTGRASNFSDQFNLWLFLVAQCLAEIKVKTQFGSRLTLLKFSILVIAKIYTPASNGQSLRSVQLCQHLVGNLAPFFKIASCITTRFFWGSAIHRTAIDKRV